MVKVILIRLKPRHIKNLFEEVSSTSAEPVQGVQMALKSHLTEC